MKQALLVGCGADIGAMLTGMLEPEKDGLKISAILTNSIPGDPNHPDLTSIDSIMARIILAQPHLIDSVDVDKKNDCIVMRGQSIPVFWGDVREFDLNSLKQTFDVAIVATSKKHINDEALMNRFSNVAQFVVGVAESTNIPAVYPSLIDAPDRFLRIKPTAIGEHKVFCLGSCQTNGWQAPLRALLELAEQESFTGLNFRAMEVDIVHPDTPTGRLGTKSVAARSQDPRNNLRPSFSQVELSMNRLFPESNNINTVALRVLVVPPGYQICRFFFEYVCANDKRLDAATIKKQFIQTAERLPSILRAAELPLGSRGFEYCEAAAVFLPQSSLFRYADDLFDLQSKGQAPISELIIQSYVHNTRGYCRSIISSIQYLLTDPSPKIFSQKG